jgi:hypothetical protein
VVDPLSVARCVVADVVALSPHVAIKMTSITVMRAGPAST